MAYTCPKNLDGFLPLLSKADTKFRQQVGADLLAFLTEPSSSVICEDIGRFIDALVLWMHNSNFKVSSFGIEITTCLIDRLGHDFRPYLQIVLPVVIDRLGDTKDTVREKAHLLLLKLLERTVLTPQTLLEKLVPGFTHKNAKIREEVLRCFVNILNEHGAHSVTVSKFTPYIANLLSDQSAAVRDTAFSTLVDLYKHVGDKLSKDLQKKNIVPAGRIQALFARFDEVQQAGELLPTATVSIEPTTDDVDRAMHKPIIPVKKPGLTASIKRQAVPRTPSNSSAPGGIDEHIFFKTFEEVPTVPIYSARDIKEEMKTIVQTIADQNKDWDKRVEHLKKIRSLIIAGAESYDEFFANLKLLDIPLQETLKDLRSQVVREACITVAYLAKTLGSKFDRTAEHVLNTLINLIQNSAKVIATAGLITVRFILQYMHNPRFIPIITNNVLSSKSKDIRRSCCECLEQILIQWPTCALEKHTAILQESLKRGIVDADPEARLSSRKAFGGFKEHFPEHAEALLQSLEPSYRRALQGELCLSSSSSSGSIAQVGNSISKTSTARSYKGSVPPRSATDSAAKGRRSNSAIDLQAAQRAKTRAQYAAMARHKIASGTYSLPRPRRPSQEAPATPPERTGRTKRRTSGVSQSQPTSRSGSPSSRLCYMGRTPNDGDSPRPRRLSSGIPRSTTGSREASRETSPSRDSSLSRLRSRVFSDRPPLSPASRPVMAQKILQQSREAESALADALTFDPNEAVSEHYRLSSPRKGMRSLENHSDDSETSSVCSERSFDSFRRASDSYSWSGSQQRLSSRDVWEPCRDVNEIIALCASTVWQERKDGLVSLRYYLNAGSELSPGELKHITEIFTKMFMDSHTKGLQIFIDTLNEIIKHYKNDLHDWLYVLLQRIFLKLGTDLLSSTQSKLLNTLEIIKKSFPVSLQLSCVFRFLVDATQTPSVKVKVTVLTYLASLCNVTEPSQLLSKRPALQALQKIILFVSDAKSAELRNAAKNAIVALWNCNTPLITMMLSELPKESQDVASGVVQSHMKTNSSAGSEPGSPLVGGSPKPLSPTSPKNVDLNREEIYRSLRKTTAEIQNYAYENFATQLDRDRDTTSQDSGISQMSLGNDVKTDIIVPEEKNNHYKLHEMSINGIHETDSNSFISSDDEQLVRQVLENCLIDNPTPSAEKLRLLTQLKTLIQQGHTDHIIPNFKKLLRIFINYLSSKEVEAQLIVLQILTEIFQNNDMKECCCNFVELLTLRILQAHCEEKKDVLKMAERTAAAAMSVFPFTTVLNVLTPLIHTSEYPSLQGAIKMLTKLIETHPNEVTDEHLKEIMPGLIKANDHEETPVRKSTVMCMVALHRVVGEERLFPYISCLPGSKVKLLRLYIGRAQPTSDTSVPTSPKNSATR